MAGTQAKAIRRADVLQRLSRRLGIEQADLRANGRGDSELALIITLERVADAVEQKIAKPVTSGTVTAKDGEIPTSNNVAIKDAKEDADAPLTVETVETIKAAPKGKGGKDAS